jgi:hypothetical protein
MGRKTRMRSARRCALALSLAFTLVVGCAPIEIASRPVKATRTTLLYSGRTRFKRRRPQPVRRDPKEDKKSAFKTIFLANQRAKRDPDAAIADLESALGRWADYNAEFHFSIAIAVDRKISRLTRASDERLSLYRRKLGHLEEALTYINAGGKWAYGPMEIRTTKLKASIKQARMTIKRLSPAVSPTH